MAYTKQTWSNNPSTATPLSAERLTYLETQYDEAVAAVPGLIAADPNFSSNAEAAVDAAITAEGGITDATVTALDADPASALRVQADDRHNATIDGKVATSEAGEVGRLATAFSTIPKNTIIPFGTSFTEGNYGPGTVQPLGYQARGYFVWAMNYLGQRVKWVRNAGVPGNTTAQMLARVQADVIAHAPGWCVLEVGPNDATNDVPAATTQANIAEIVTLLTAAGIKVAVTTPTTNATHTLARLQLSLTVGTWLRTWAHTQKNVVLVDFASVWVNPLDGYPVTLLTDDGTHPSPDGAAALGKVLADALSPRIPAVRVLPASNIDPGNLLTNGMGTGNVGGLPTGNAINGTLTAGARVATPTKVVRTDGLPGEWSQIAIGPGNLAQVTDNWATITAGFIPGDTVEAMIEWQRLPGAVTVFGTTQQFLQAKLIAIGGTAGETTWCSRVTTEKVWTLWPSGGVARLPPLVVPAGTTGLVLQFSAWGVDTMTLQIGAAIVRKVAA